LPPRASLTEIADAFCAAYDNLNLLDRDIEDSNLSLYKRVWSAPAASIDELATKARVLDKKYRENGKPHSVTDDVWKLIDEIPAMAVRS
jgi:hypothetical protein